MGESGMRDYEVNTKGHVWQKNEYDDKVDIMAMCYDFHNGPKCINCGYDFCHHCQDGPTIICTGGDGDAKNNQ